MLGSFAHGKQNNTMPGRAADAAIRPDELRLASREEHRISLYRVFVEPGGACVGADYGDSVAVCQELLQPRDVTITTAEGDS